MLILWLSATVAAPTTAFETNVGQAPANVTHLVRGDHEVAFITNDGFVLSVPTRDTLVSLQAQWRGATNRVNEGMDELQGSLHYFIGSAEGRRASRFGAVAAGEVYPGIDLRYDLSETLRFGFVLAPGADVTKIRLGFDHDVKPRVSDRQVELAIVDASDRTVLTVRLAQLKAWQMGETGREEVAVKFVQRDSDLGFALGAHDPDRTVYIDPDITYASYIGSTSIEEGRDVAVDAAGMVYVTGYSINAGAMFPTTQGALQPMPQGGLDPFVVKVDPSATGAAALVYGSYLGGNFDDRAEGIAVDATGRAVIGGSTSFASTNTFPSTANAYSQTPQSAFLTMLNATGSQLVYSTFFGSTGSGVTAIDVDPSGAVIAVGASGGGIPEVNGLTVPPTARAFAVKFDVTQSQAASVVYGTRFNSDGAARAVAVDASGIYIQGVASTGLPTTPGAAQPAHAAGRDYYVAKLDPNQAGAAAVVYTTYVGGIDDDGGTVYYDGIDVDATGAAYITGLTFSSFVTTAGSYAPTPPGGGEGFLVKLNPTGTQFVFSTYLGAVGNDGGYDVAVDAAGQAYVVGAGGGPPVTGCGGPSTGTAFIAQYDAQGQNLLQASYLSSGANIVPYAIALGSNGRAYVAGSVAPPTQIATPGAFQPVQAGPDAFVAELSASAACADLDVSLSATPNPVAGAAPVDLQVVLQNIGPDDVSRAELSVFVPPELAVRSASGCTGGPSYVCAVGALTAGSSATVTLQIEATAAGTFTATAAVQAMVADPDSNNNAGQVAVVVTAPNNPCGFETLYGSCKGATLSFCEDRGRPAERLTQVDCSADAFPTGVPGECTLINQTYGFDCAVSIGGACAFLDAQDEPFFALCAGDNAGCQIDPVAGVAQCEVGLPMCIAEGFDVECAADLLIQECTVDQPVALDCTSIGGRCVNGRCEELPLGSPCEDGRLLCAAGLVCDAVSQECEDPALRCDPTTYRSSCNGETLTACDRTRSRVTTFDCRDAFDPADGTSCGAPFTCTGRSCDDVNATCIGARAGARCDIAREIYCGAGLGCVIERDDEGALFGTCRATTTCGASAPAAACIADVAAVCLSGDGIIAVEAQGVDCASFGGVCAPSADSSICVGSEGAVCQVLSRQDALLRCAAPLTCDEIDDEGFGRCRGGPDLPDAGEGPDGSRPSVDAGMPDAGEGPNEKPGCACRCSPAHPGSIASPWGLAVVALWLRQRRKR